MDKELTIYYGDMDSPIGDLSIFATNKGICALKFGDPDCSQIKLKTKLNKNLQTIHFTYDENRVAEAIKQLDEYFRGRRKSFHFPFDIQGTPFQLKVWEQLTKIDYGETLSYKAIAAAIGAPKAVRAVGGANNKNPIPIIIPCHRVIGSNGSLVGYGGGLKRKEYLLQLEKSSLHQLTS